MILGAGTNCAGLFCHLPAMVPEWSKGNDLRSFVRCTPGFKPLPWQSEIKPSVLLPRVYFLFQIASARSPSPADPRVSESRLQVGQSKTHDHLYDANQRGGGGGGGFNRIIPGRLRLSQGASVQTEQPLLWQYFHYFGVSFFFRPWLSPSGEYASILNVLFFGSNPCQPREVCGSWAPREREM
jgi:hypothetical protein